MIPSPQISHHGKISSMYDEEYLDKQDEALFFLKKKGGSRSELSGRMVIRVAHSEVSHFQSELLLPRPTTYKKVIQNAKKQVEEILEDSSNLNLVDTQKRVLSVYQTLSQEIIDDKDEQLTNQDLWKSIKSVIHCFLKIITNCKEKGNRTQ